MQRQHSALPLDLRASFLFSLSIFRETPPLQPLVHATIRRRSGCPLLRAPPRSKQFGVVISTPSPGAASRETLRQSAPGNTPRPSAPARLISAAAPEQNPRRTRFRGFSFPAAGSPAIPLRLQPPPFSCTGTAT